MSVQQIDWDLALIQKYNYSGPRYTSYPTALEFSEDFGEQAFLQAVARYPERPLSLYVHIPFCHKLCYFCGCNKIVTRQQHKADQYLDALEHPDRYDGKTMRVTGKEQSANQPSEEAAARKLPVQCRCGDFDRSRSARNRTGCTRSFTRRRL